MKIVNRSEKRSVGKFDWGDHGDNPWKFLNNVMVKKIGCVPWNLLEMKQKSDGFHIMMLFQSKFNFDFV